MGRAVQFYPIAIAGSHSEAYKIIELLKEERDKNSVLKIKTPELMEWRAKLEKANRQASEAQMNINICEIKEYEKIKS